MYKNSLAFFLLMLVVTACIPEAHQVKLAHSAAPDGDYYVLSVLHDPQVLADPPTKLYMEVLKIDDVEINKEIKDRTLRFGRHFNTQKVAYTLKVPAGEHALQFNLRFYSDEWYEVEVKSQTTNLKFNGLPGKRYEVRTAILDLERNFGQKPKPTKIQWKLIEVETGKIIEQSTIEVAD